MIILLSRLNAIKDQTAEEMGSKRKLNDLGLTPSSKRRHHTVSFEIFRSLPEYDFATFYNDEKTREISQASKINITKYTPMISRVLSQTFA